MSLRPYAALSLAIATTTSIATVTAPSLAKDVGTLGGAPVRVDITETSLLNYHVDNRNDTSPTDVQGRLDDNYGEWLNKFNIAAAWKEMQAGIRFDTATYFHKPQLSSFDEGPQRDAATNAMRYRLRDTYVIPPFMASKLYVTYAKPDLEATVGDGYVSFGRGLVLTIRKLDELAADTSLQGAKVLFRQKWFAFTAVAGLANPVRIDESTGAQLRDPAADADNPYQSAWSRDLIVGSRFELKLGSSTIGLHGADVHRRDEIAAASGSPTFAAKDILAGGLSIAIPKISDAIPLNVYAEVAVQKRNRFADAVDTGIGDGGYAAYGSTSFKAGIVTTQFEGKHYRGYYPVKLNADQVRYLAFSAVQYNAPPTVERITQDSLFDNSCTTGGRVRFDVKPTKSYGFFASGAYFANWGERSPTRCNTGPALGLLTLDANAPLLKNNIYDGFIGFELRSLDDGSYMSMLGGIRRDQESETGNTFYREGFIEYDFVKTLDANYSMELSGRDRNRFEGSTGESWYEGEKVLALKYTSKRSIFIGHEYTTQPSKMRAGQNGLFSGLGNRNSGFLASENIQHFVYVGGSIRFNDNVFLRMFVGQQRGALKCVSGVCRQFPAFEGARTELVVTY